MKSRTRALLTVSIALFTTVLVWFNYSAVLPLVVKDWNLTSTEAGIIFGAFQAGYLLTIIPAGWLADRYSPRWVISVGATGTGIGSIAFAIFATGFLSGTMFRLLSGLFVAGVYVPGMRFVSDYYPPDVRGRAIGLYVGTFSVGSGLSFLLSTGLADAFGWEVAIIVTSVGTIIVAPLLLFGTKDSPNRTAQEGVKFHLSVLRNKKYLSSVSIYSWHNWELYGVRNWLLVFILATPAFAATGPYSATAAGLLVAVVTAMSGVGNILGGVLSDRIGRSTTISMGLTGSMLISAFLGFLGWIPIWAFVSLLLVYGALLSVDSAPVSTLVTEVVEEEYVGTALSLQSFVGFSTTVVSPIVFGLALDVGGYELAWPTLAVGAFMGLASVVVFRRLPVETV